MAGTHSSEAVLLSTDVRCCERALHYDGDIRFDIVKKICDVVLFFFEYLLPISIFVICYTRMFICLRNQYHPHTVNVGSDVSVPNARRRRHVLKTLVLVVVANLMCNYFNHIHFLAFNFSAPLNIASYYYNFTVIARFAVASIHSSIRFNIARIRTNCGKYSANVIPLL